MSFEAYEQAPEIGKSQYRKRAAELRKALLEAQVQLQEAGVPVVMLFAGVDGAGKGETANLMQEWMDTHFIVTRAFGPPSDEERERPAFWRFWRDIPPKGHIGIFLSAWYHKPLLDRVQGLSDEAAFEQQLDEVVSFETTLANDRMLILKFWMHLDKQGQRERFEELEADPLRRWRVTEKDWRHWRMYDQFMPVTERIIERTSTPQAPWRIIDGSCLRHSGLRVGEILLESIRAHLAAQAQPDAQPDADGDADSDVGGDPGAGAGGGHPSPAARADAGTDAEPTEATDAAPAAPTVLAQLDMSQAYERSAYREELERQQGYLNLLHRRARDQGVSTVLVFEGWDAAGKGGAIRRITAALDARAYRVIQIAAPTDEEQARHYLWRFWRHMGRAGRVSIFDRSWYGRVLVERVEGFASTEEWSRAYDEINEFEAQLAEHRIAVVKFWLHITKDEQQRRFEGRQKTPYKRWKLTAEDWRNRERWSAYEQAVDEMIRRTHTDEAPWVVVEGDDKRFARIKVLESVCSALQRALR